VETQDKGEINSNEKSEEKKKKKKRFASSWDAKAAGAEEGTKADYLSNLGQAQGYNINVTHGTLPPSHAYSGIFVVYRVMQTTDLCKA